MSRKILMYYNVQDVEHIGYVSYEEYLLQLMGAEIVDTDIEWGEENIEQATIQIAIDSKAKEEFVGYGCYE